MNDAPTTEATSRTDAPGLPVIDAARALGVSERTLRRLLIQEQFEGKTVAVWRQTQKGRRRTETLPPALVAEIRAHLDTLKPETGPFDAPAQSEAGTTAIHGETTAVAGSAAEPPANTETVETVLLREALARMEAENGRLWESLKTEQENTKAALAQLADARREGQMIMGAVAAGRLQIASVDTQDGQSGPETSESGQTAGNDAAETPRPFWAFWRRSGG